MTVLETLILLSKFQYVEQMKTADSIMEAAVLCHVGAKCGYFQKMRITDTIENHYLSQNAYKKKDVAAKSGIGNVIITDYSRSR